MTATLTRPARCLEALPTRPSYCRGACLEYRPQTRVLELVTDRRSVRRYFVRELDSANLRGRGFRLCKVACAGTDPEARDYCCLLADDGRDSCECKGFLRWNHCGHLAALRTLLAGGWLDVPVELPAEDELPDWVREGGIGERADLPF